MVQPEWSPDTMSPLQDVTCYFTKWFVLRASEPRVKAAAIFFAKFQQLYNQFKAASFWQLIFTWILIFISPFENNGTGLICFNT